MKQTHFQIAKSSIQSIWLNLMTCVILLTLFSGFVGCSSEPVSSPESRVEGSVVAMQENVSAEKFDIPDLTSNVERTITRLFWQDRDKAVLCAGDLRKKDGKYSIEPVEIKDFPQLDAKQNDLVQMVVCRGRLIVGVRDHDDGRHNSGWIEVATGVEEEDHGAHSHWHYSGHPYVSSSTLDTGQGNPAHVYQYGKHVYLANDKNNGFTEINPVDGSASFYRGGGGHITMAAVNDRIAYSTWIDRDGENKGRVDVINLRKKITEPEYSFYLPTGGIHGAGACGNRVYFAPSSGVCWVNCDFDFAKSTDTVEVQHLSLDENADGGDYRTGAFESFRDHILCVARSKNGESVICVIDATAPEPRVARIPCGEFAADRKLSTVVAGTASGGKCLAFAFAEGDGPEEKLLIFDLDPNGDRSFLDAEFLSELEVGKSKLQGHFGHHGITFAGDNRTALITNPGDGTLSILDLEKLQIVQTMDVGGQPTHITNHGEVSD